MKSLSKLSMRRGERLCLPRAGDGRWEEAISKGGGGGSPISIVEPDWDLGIRNRDRY